MEIIEKDENLYQQKFFEEIKQKHDPSNTLPVILSEILNVSLDSAYRRLRGKTPLILPEIIKICKHFNVTFSYSVQQAKSSKVNFFYKSLCGEKDLLEDLSGCLNDLNNKLVSLSESPKAVLYLTLTDLPVFYFSNFEELAVFRLRVWLNEMTGCNMSAQNDFSTSLQALLKILSNIHANLEKVARVEIWSDNTINNVLESIIYYYQTGELSSKEDAHLLLDQMCTLLDALYKDANEEVKEVPKEVFWSEVELSNGYMIAESEGTKLSMVKMFSINSIFTYDEVIYDDIKKWIDLRINNSVLISRSNRKQRHLFFSRMIEKVKQHKIYLDNLE